MAIAQQLLLAKYEQILAETTTNSSNCSLFRQALSLSRSLILNPTTSQQTISSIFETLAHSLHSTHNPLFLHHTLSLLSDIAAHRPSLSHRIFSVILSFSLHSNNSARILSDALSVLLSVSERNQALVHDISEHSEVLFISLCFRPCVVSVRRWLLLNADKFNVRPSLLLSVLLGFTKDPYPYVRREALVGLVGLCKSVLVEDHRMIEACYSRAVELLYDMDDSVRCSAIRAVSEWGLLLVASIDEESSGNRDWSDLLFVQICSMVRDMSVEVRIEVFNSLGKVGKVSEDILLQTLTKKVLSSIKEKKYPGQFTAKNLELPASCAAGAFVHGLEDEFCEVRGSACCSLRPLAILSPDFASEALNLVMDVLNDDSADVHLKALETMYHMAMFGYLKVQETHMHMFLGGLVDTMPLIRSSVRKVLKLTKLNKLVMFKLAIDGLIENLEMYPQDEADVFSALFNISQRHGKFTSSIIKEVSQDIEPSSEGKLGFDSVKSAALLVLAISSPLSNENSVCSIPPKIFSYAVTYLGRISRGLAGVMDLNTLLDYLSQCSRSAVIFASDFIKGEEQILPNEVNECVKLIISQVNCVWPFIQFGLMGEVLRSLRSWKEELKSITTDSYKSCDTVVFALQYIHVIKLLAKLWVQYSNGFGNLGLILPKIEKNLLQLRYMFLGLSKEEELHILELILVNYVLRLYSGEEFYDKLRLKKIYSTISRVEFLHKEGSTEPSGFVNEVKKSLPDICNSQFLFQKLLGNFTLNQFIFVGEIKHVRAEVVVENNDCENHLPFVSGLPVGIPFEITLYNVSSEERLWVRMSANKDNTQFAFMDLEVYGGCDSVRKFTFVAPFYKTPKAKCFTLRACVGMECCVDEDEDDLVKVGKRELVYVCKEKEVYLSMVSG